MSDAVHTATVTADRRTNRRLAFGVLAAPLAWFFNEIIGVAVVGRECAPGNALSSGQWTVIGITTVVALSVALAAAVVCWKVLRAQRVHVPKAEGWNRVEFLALFGLFVSALLLLNIVFFGVLPLVVEPCTTAI